MLNVIYAECRVFNCYAVCRVFNCYAVCRVFNCYAECCCSDRQFMLSDMLFNCYAVSHFSE
jgi:hypothetical protein